MKKRIVSLVLVLLQLILCLAPMANASGNEYEQINITVDQFGIQNEETVLKTADGTVLVPHTWLTRYGMMACTEETGRYVFTNPGEDRNLRFAKRIYVDRNGENAVYGYYTSGTYAGELKFVEMETVDFTVSYAKDGVLYLPLAEYLPLFNASVEVTDDGVLHINANTVSVFSALYGLEWNKLEFEADQITGNWFIAGSGLLVDTIFDWRFDRLDLLGNSGQIEDYRKLFKGYLTDDAAFLSAYDREKTPEDKYVDMVCDILNHSSDVTGRTGAMPKFASYFVESDEYPLAKEISEGGFSDFAGILGTGKDILKGGYKLVSYYHTYSNQVEDHYKMLEAVYGDGYYRSSDPACAAALETLKLYGEMGKETQEVVAKEFAEYLAGEVIEDLLTDNAVVKPYKLALAVVKAACPEMVEEFSDAALLYFMDAVVDDAQDVFEFEARGIKLDQTGLEKLRLSAMLALIASRNAFETYDTESGAVYGDEIAVINEWLEKLYLAADSSAYEACGNYEKCKERIEREVLLLTGAEEPFEGNYPAAKDLFNNTCWYMAYGQTLGLNYYGLFQTDGTLRVICVNGLEYPDGTYDYDPSTGRMTVYFNNWADEFQYGDGSFISVEKYQMQVGEEYLTISPDPDGMRYFEEQPAETEPVVTEPPATEDPVEGYYGEPLSELEGTWYAYDTVNGQDYAWCLYLGENGYGSIGMGTPNSEIDEGHEFIWGAEAEGDTYYYLMMSSQTDNWGTFLFVTRENGKLRLERNDGMSDSILASSWYERDLDYQTWLERKSQFAVEFEGHHEYVLLRNPYIEGNSMDVYLWSDVMDLACWEGEVGSDNLIRVEVTGVVLDEWNYDYYGDGEMILTHWSYDEDGRLFLQGTNLEGDQNMEYLISADGQVAITLSGDSYAYDYQGSFLGIRYVLDTVHVEIASDCRYLDNRSGQSESVSEWELLEYLASESSYNYTHITVTITVRDDGVYITQIEIPYFP